MLDEGVLSRAKCPSAWKMMCSAVQNRDTAMVDLLQQNGIESIIDVRRKELVYPREFTTGHVDCRPLSQALEYADMSVLRVLVKHGFTKGGMMEKQEGVFLPLYYAAGRKKITAAVRCLLDIGADPNIDEYIMAPVILWAIYNRDLETLRLLLDHGARIWDVWCDRGLIKNQTKITWLREKETTEWDTKAAELILSRVPIKALMVSDAGSRDRVMNLAALCGSVSVIKQILGKRSHEDTKPWGSRTFLHDDIDKLQLPLALAAKWRHLDVFAMMLDYGADPSAQGADIWSGVLYNAISSGDIKIVRMLLDRGIGIDFKNPKSNDKLELGVYALISAARFPSIFQLLLDREALYPGYSSDSIQSLMAAVVESGNVMLLWALLDKGVLLGVMSGPDYLKYATRGGLNMLEYLAPYGVLEGPTEDLIL